MPQILNPDVPFVGAVNGLFDPGEMIRIQGSTPANAQRFNINIQCGPHVSPRDDIALHLAVHLLDKCIVRNSLENQNWATEEDSGPMPLAPGQHFEILILCEVDEFKIAINGQHYCQFKHRIPHSRISHLTIDGDVLVSLINFESGMPENTVDASQMSQPQYGPPQQPMGMFQPGAPQYDPSYNPAMGQGGAPPPPPGYNENGKKTGGSDFGNIINQAGAALAGALATGGILSSLSNRQSNMGPLSSMGNIGGMGGFPFSSIGGGYPGRNQEPFGRDGGSGGLGSFLANTLTNSLFSNTSRR